jgi:hypothetical protein
MAVEMRRLGTSFVQLGVLAAIPATILVFLLLSRLVAARGVAGGAESLAVGAAICAVLAGGGIPLGVALRRHREWAREILLELAWFVAAAAVAGPLILMMWCWRQGSSGGDFWVPVGVFGFFAAVILIVALRIAAWLKSPVILAVFAPDTPGAAEALATLGKDLAAERAARWRVLSKAMREFGVKMLVFGFGLAIVPPAVLYIALLDDVRGLRVAAGEWLSDSSHGWVLAAIALAHLIAWLLVIGGIGFLRRREWARRMLILVLKSCLAIGAGVWLVFLVARLASSADATDVLAFVIPSMLLGIPAIPVFSDLKGLRSAEAREWCV